jgi:Glycosyl hydrolase family 59
MATAGRPPWPRSINNGYNQAGVTGYLHWPLLDAIPPGLPHQDQGLVFADEPWSGQYQVNENVRDAVVIWEPGAASGQGR